MKPIFAAFALICTLSAAGSATIQLQTIEYHAGQAVLEGQLVYDDATAGPRPGVIVIHDWMGPNAFARQRAQALARLGYAAFVADMYGKGVRPKDAKEAGAEAGKLKADRGLLRARANAALTTFAQQTQVDPKRIAAIGYCFGGTTALELARSGARVAGVVSFHGGLDTPTPQDAKNIKGKVLVLHGALDPHVPPEQVAAFEKEMNDAKVDWTLVKYSGAVHAFAVPSAGNDPSKGAAYNATADKRSWEAMQDFLKEIFKQ